MQPVEDKIAIQENLAQLRLDSFKTILFMTSIVGWFWFSWAIWPQPLVERIFRSDIWIASGLLLVVVLISHLLRKRNIYLATVIFIGGVVAAITCAIYVFGSPDAAYLYVIPVIFSSVLLSQTWLIAATLFTALQMLIAGLIVPDLHPIDFIPSLITVGLSAGAISISTNNLQTTLAWTFSGYQQAHKNALLARERQAKLERVLKSLDTAMSNLQRMNVQLVQARNQAEEARKLKQQFAQSISHELRTPLNLIVGFTETMIKSPEYYGAPLSPIYLRDLSVVYRNACHLQTLVNDVLDLARLESAYMSLESEELNLAVVIQDAINTARSLVEGRGLTLTVDLVPDLPPVWGDAVRLKQVILNLLNNAARFTEQGGVTVSAFVQDTHVVVAVSDTGIGIPAENTEDIFESFRQLENPMQRRKDGAGLGLAISKQLIHLHGGRIWVESQVGIGSTFYFSLPIGRLDMLLDRPVPVPQGDRQGVMLGVTRSPSAASLLSRSLSDYRMVIVPDLLQAQNAVEKVVPQAIIIDSGTENLDNGGLRNFIQSLKQAPITIITCPLPGEEPLRKSLEVDGYLIKPISRESLWDTLRQFSEELSRVLVVDDDRDFVRLITRMLSSPIREYHMTYAYSGREALEMVKYNVPEIMLLDLNLPDMHGLQLIEAIRSDPGLDHIHIVVITAYEETDSLHLANGTLSITRPSGLVPTDIMKWIQAILSSSAVVTRSNEGKPE